MWILTEEFNDYDQHGEYFRAAWNEKPTEEVLLNFFIEGGLEGYTNYKESWVVESLRAGQIAEVAQTAERWTENPQAAGSIPALWHQFLGGRMKKLVFFLTLALVGCSDDDSYYTGLKMVQEYKEANKCVPQSFLLKDKNYDFCSARGGCNNFSYQYYQITYQCKDGKRLVTEIKA